MFDFIIVYIGNHLPCLLYMYVYFCKYVLCVLFHITINIILLGSRLWVAVFIIIIFLLNDINSNQPILRIFDKEIVPQSITEPLSIFISWRLIFQPMRAAKKAYGQITYLKKEHLSAGILRISWTFSFVSKM